MAASWESSVSEYLQLLWHPLQPRIEEPLHEYPYSLVGRDPPGHEVVQLLLLELSNGRLVGKLGIRVLCYQFRYGSDRRGRAQYHASALEVPLGEPVLAHYLPPVVDLRIARRYHLEYRLPGRPLSHAKDLVPQVDYRVLARVHYRIELRRCPPACQICRGVALDVLDGLDQDIIGDERAPLLHYHRGPRPDIRLI